MRTSCVIVATSLFFFACLPLKLFAWNETGHMLVAQIAYDKLKPTAREKVDKMLVDFQREYPEVKSFEQLACWPDMIRWQKIDTFSHWHYIDQPLLRDNATPVNTVDTDNVIWAINKIKPILRNERANVYERARFLAMYAHIIGDIHQPLHTVSLVTPDFPKGDQGGNLYFIRYNGKRINLHKLWDEAVGMYSQNIAPEQVAYISNQLTARYPEAYFAERMKLVSAEDWAKEGVNMSNTYVYATPKDQIPSEAYVQSGQKVAQEQIVIAGYRLAQALNELLA